MSYATLEDLKKAIEEAETAFNKAGINLDEVPVLLTDDDEFNGIHISWDRSGIADQSLVKSLKGTCMGVSVPKKALESDYFFIVG